MAEEFRLSEAAVGPKVSPAQSSVTEACARARSEEKWWKLYSRRRYFRFSLSSLSKEVWAKRLCDREEGILDWQARCLAWKAWRTQKRASSSKLERRARILVARVSRYRFAKDLIHADPLASVQTLVKTEWDNVSLPAGVRHTDDSYVLMGTIVLLPLILLAGLQIEKGLVWVVRAGWLYPWLEAILDNALIAGMLASIVLMPVFLGLYTRTAKWITWLSSAGWIAFLLSIIHDPSWL